MATPEVTRRTAGRYPFTIKEFRIDQLVIIIDRSNFAVAIAIDVGNFDVRQNINLDFMVEYMFKNLRTDALHILVTGPFFYSQGNSVGHKGTHFIFGIARQYAELEAPIPAI